MLGVGLAYQGPLRGFIEDHLESIDFLEVVPDILWTDAGPGNSPRYFDDPDGVSFLKQLRKERMVVPHSIGLSIGSAHRFDREHITQLRRWYDWLQFPWHSDHLSYHMIEHGGREMNVGITVPLPRDQETLELLAPRVAAVKEEIPVPFLLENNVYYFDIPEAPMPEAEFLNRMCRICGCGLLLDLHNIYVNGRNHDKDPLHLLEQLDLNNVVEIHVAGGMEHGGFYLDAHSGPLPEGVWKLLDHALPACPNLGAVVFELFGSWYPEVGPDPLRAELEQLKNCWRKHLPEPALVAI